MTVSARGLRAAVEVAGLVILSAGGISHDAALDMTAGERLFWRNMYGTVRGGELAADGVTWAKKPHV